MAVWMEMGMVLSTRAYLFPAPVALHRENVFILTRDVEFFFELSDAVIAR